MYLSLARHPTAPAPMQPTLLFPTATVRSHIAPIFERIQDPRSALALSQHRNHCNCRCLRASIYHYVTKSKEDFEAKSKRGGGSGIKREIPYFHMMDKHAKDSCTGALDNRRRFGCDTSGVTREALWAAATATGVVGLPKGKHIGGLQQEEQPDLAEHN